MALRTTEDSDKKLNPEDSAYERKFNGPKADDIAAAEQAGTFDDSEENSDKNADSPQKNANADSAREREENPTGGWVNNTTANSDQRKMPGLYVSRFRKKGPIIGIILTLLVGGGGIGFFVGPVLAPLAFFENITDDLNDQLGALDTREGYVFRNKLSSADRNAALSGCTKLSIRCKFATITEKQVSRLKSSGIDVSPSEGNLFGRRVKPTSYRFQGQDYTPEAWAEQLKTNRYAKTAQRRANNMKFYSTDDSTFNRVLKRFGISKKPPELSGSARDRVNALMNKAGATSAVDLTFSPVNSNEDGTPTSDTRYTLDGDSSGTTYSHDEVERMKSSISRVANARPPSRVTKASVGALSVLGYWDLGCSIKNLLVGASVAAKIANQAELIQFVMPLASKVGQLKAGDISPEDAEALGTFFSQTDNRAKIVNLADSVSGVSADASGSITLNDELAMTDNPDYGKSAMDSTLYQMSAGGGVAASSASHTLFSLGMGQNSLLSGLSNGADVASALLNVGDANACRFVQNPLVRILGFAVGVVGAVGSGGGSAIAQGAIAAGMLAAMLVLDNVVNNALSGSLLDNADLEEAPVGRGDAAWTGVSAMLGNAAQQRGLMPGSSEQIVEYAQLQNSTKNEYIAMESETANPLDVKNQYSFLGSFARSISGYSSSGTGVSSFLSNISSVVKGGFSSLTKPYSAYAATMDESRFKQCDDDSYQALGINADVQCNIRYIMPTEDLQMDTDEVALWMEQNGYVEADTSTGLPVGYTPPEPQQSQGLAMDYVSGAVDSVVNNRTLPNDYARFLDYCVYRTLPFGETGEETSAFGDDSPEWKSGQNCMKTEAPFNYFRIYTLDKSVQEILDDEDDPEPASSSDSTSDPQTLPTGTAQELAKRILATGNVVDGTGQIGTIASGASVVSGNTDPRVLGVILGIAQSGFKFTVSSLARNYVPANGSRTSWHLDGRAADISGRAGINGVPFNQNQPFVKGIGYGGGADPVALSFIVRAAAYLPANCQLGVPNIQYVNAVKPLVKSGCYVFIDQGTSAHIHLGVPN